MMRESALGEVIVSEESIRNRIQELAAQIDVDYAGKEVLLVGVLKGAIVFLVDLARCMTVPLAMDFMAVSSYGAATESSGVVRILKDLDDDIQGKHVLVVEDIVDSGLTLSYLTDYLSARGPASLRICSLLVKDRPVAAPPIDYVGFVIPDRFVVGFGLDYAERYRNTPFIAELLFTQQQGITG